LTRVDGAKISRDIKHTTNAQTRPPITKSGDTNPLTHVRVGPAQPIHIPSNAERPHNDYSRAANNLETHGGFYETPWEPRKTTAEAEKDLQDLLQQGFDGKEDGQSSRDEIDMSQAVVDGFRDGIRLLPHQITGRIWMTERESGKKFGGILADDMGLGKTIQTLARIVDGRPRKSDAESGRAAATLWVCYLLHVFIAFSSVFRVVCPVSLVSQWASEISKMAKNLTVIEHHGASRTTSTAQHTPTTFF